MDVKPIRIGNKTVSPFTIPSGIITCEASAIERIANEIPELGVITTKSIGPRKRIVPRDPNEPKPEGVDYANREPILAQYAPGCFVNAVGLQNLGDEEAAEKLSRIDIPENKFLLGSIFGGNPEEFGRVARNIAPHVDGLELNLSCPHVKGAGMQVGQDPEMVGRIVYEVSKNTGKPIFAKLTPNAQNIGEIAKAAMNAGATGITAINTVGPRAYTFNGVPVLTNKVGGLSGVGILPFGISAVRDIRSAIGPDGLIIGMGGISTAQDVIEYAHAGANVFGIGSALGGMTENDLKHYFRQIVRDVENGTNEAVIFLKKVDMTYKPTIVSERIDLACDFKVIRTLSSINAMPGQFVFAYLPGVGEKPFSIMDDNPLTLGVLERGLFTKQFNALKPGDNFYIRGPYGEWEGLDFRSKIILVGGGCGIAGIHLVAKHYSEFKPEIFLGAKDKNHLGLVDELRRYGQVHIATDDGSEGHKGSILDLVGYEGAYTDLLDKGFGDRPTFVNCGPRVMIDAAINMQRRLTTPDRIYSSVDYMTRCGVGICGSCADEKGLRTCVEGPFMKADKK